MISRCLLVDFESPSVGVSQTLGIMGELLVFGRGGGFDFLTWIIQARVSLRRALTWLAGIVSVPAAARR